MTGLSDFELADFGSQHDKPNPEEQAKERLTTKTLSHARQDLMLVPCGKSCYHNFETSASAAKNNLCSESFQTEYSLYLHTAKPFQRQPDAPRCRRIAVFYLSFAQQTVHAMQAAISSLRHALIGFLLAVFTADSAVAQEWAQKMFSTTEHDFGLLARGSETQFAFELTNVYKEDIHISDVRSSCGCTRPRISKPWLKTWEKGHILCAFDTRSYTGDKKAVVTVVFDQPFPAEVQLNITGQIRGDVVFHPGMVEFGEVNLGETVQKTIRVEYVGRNNLWDILDVRSENTSLEVELSEAGRGRGRVTYDMVVRLTDRAPVGYIQNRLNLITNDLGNESIPLSLNGRVVPAVTVSPASLSLGIVQPGKTVSKRLVVRSTKPFRILAVRCQEDCFQFETPDGAKKMHFVPVNFTADVSLGKIVQKIEIETDLATGASASCVATAIVK